MSPEERLDRLERAVGELALRAFGNVAPRGATALHQLMVLEWARVDRADRGRAAADPHDRSRTRDLV